MVYNLQFVYNVYTPYLEVLKIHKKKMKKKLLYIYIFYFILFFYFSYGFITLQVMEYIHFIQTADCTP
jgi:hypothetical protein